MRREFHLLARRRRLDRQHTDGGHTGAERSENDQANQYGAFGVLIGTDVMSRPMGRRNGLLAMGKRRPESNIRAIV